MAIIRFPPPPYHYNPHTPLMSNKYHIDKVLQDSNYQYRPPTSSEVLYDLTVLITVSIIY